MSGDYERTLRELSALAARGVEPGLERMERALDLLGHPERAFEVVHVAGTNGKGSVSVGVYHGIDGKAGLFTSPHLHSLVERFRVRGVPDIDRGTVAAAWQTLKPKLSARGAPRLTFFEVVTVLSFLVFAERGVDTVVLETGLGGRLDATNVFPRPRACAITRIGLDHTKLLGPDLASIAREKAGILRPGVPAVIAPQLQAALSVIEAEAQRIGAPLVRIGRQAAMVIEDDRMTVTYGDRVAREPRGAALGAHQRQNAAVVATMLFVLEDQGVAVNVERGAFEAHWPGRLERITAHGARWLLDAAHNPDGCEALASYLRERVPDRPRVLLFGAMADKDWPRMLERLGSVVDDMVFTRPELSRAERPEHFATHFGGTPIEDVDRAMKKASALAASGLVVVAGSLFLVADVRARLLGLEGEPPIAL